uniref:Uncharacterized protein n=1 Tax=Leersia perrieri TaxID=77586 RepID=A0A0D9W3D1_9ORYZ
MWPRWGIWPEIGPTNPDGPFVHLFRRGINEPWQRWHVWASSTHGDRAAGKSQDDDGTEAAEDSQEWLVGNGEG